MAERNLEGADLWFVETPKGKRVSRRGSIVRPSSFQAVSPERADRLGFVSAVFLRQQQSAFSPHLGIALLTSAGGGVIPTSKCLQILARDEYTPADAPHRKLLRGYQALKGAQTYRQNP
jgi:hypothetical protein